MNRDIKSLTCTLGDAILSIKKQYICTISFAFVYKNCTHCLSSLAMYLFPIHISEVVLYICNLIRFFLTFCISSGGYYNFLNGFIFTLYTWRFIHVLWISKDIDKSIRSFIHPDNTKWNHCTAPKLSWGSPTHPSTLPSNTLASTDHCRADALLFWSCVLSRAHIFLFVVIIKLMFHQIILIPCHNVKQVTCSKTVA